MNGREITIRSDALVKGHLTYLFNENKEFKVRKTGADIKQALDGKRMLLQDKYAKLEKEKVDVAEAARSMGMEAVDGASDNHPWGWVKEGEANETQEMKRKYSDLAWQCREAHDELESVGLIMEMLSDKKSYNLSMGEAKAIYGPLEKGAESEQLTKAMSGGTRPGHKYYKREGTPGKYKYYYSEKDYKAGRSHSGPAAGAGGREESKKEKIQEAIELGVKFRKYEKEHGITEHGIKLYKKITQIYEALSGAEQQHVKDEIFKKTKKPDDKTGQGAGVHARWGKESGLVQGGREAARKLMAGTDRSYDIWMGLAHKEVKAGVDHKEAARKVAKQYGAEQGKWYGRLLAGVAQALKEDKAKGKEIKKALTANQDKVHRVMREFAAGKLKSSSGAKVTSREQAVAIALAEAGLSRKGKKVKKGGRRGTGLKRTRVRGIDNKWHTVWVREDKKHKREEQGVFGG